MKAATASFRVLILLTLLFQALPTKALDSGGAGIAFGLPEAKSGVAYEFAIKTEGGQPPLRWQVLEGELPPGIELQPSGTLRGTPNTVRSQSYEFTLQVSDSSQPPQTYSQKFSVAVAPPALRMVLNSGTRLTIVPTTQENGSSPAVSTGASEHSRPTASTASPFSLETVIISGSLKGGNEAVKGYITPRAEKVFVEVFSGTASGRDSLINRIPVKSIDINTGEFTEKLSPPLKKDQRVRVVGLLIEGSRQLPLISDEVTVGAPEPEKLAPVPSIKKPLFEGAHSVSGIAAALPDGKPARVRVEIYNGEELAQVAETDDLKKTGDFTVNFDAPLAAGQAVRAQAIVDKTPGEKTPAKDNPNQVEELGDWGRARANFAFGAVFSKERENFSKSDPYLDFSLHWNWLQREKSHLNFTYMFNTFFETRLTTIPVDPDKQDQSAKVAETPPTEPAKCDPSIPDGFLCSRKSVMVQIGTYLPLYWNNRFSWSHRGDRNVLFFAPILKAGMNTLTDDGEKGRNLLTFYSGGLRFGHFDVGKFTTPPSLSRAVAPRLISYLDITIGKWQNLEYLGERRFRTEFEGRVKIPGLPMRFGFDANVGKGADDLRFLIDTNFDVGKLFKKVTQGN